MITDSAVFADRAKLVSPQTMVPPLLFLVSDRSSHVTGKRFVSSLWDAGKDDQSNVAAASSLAGWSDTPHANKVPT